MNLQQRLQTTKARAVAVEDQTSITSGIWLRWSVLTQAERVVCSTIVLLPILWLVSWSHILSLFVIAITIYEFRKNGKLHLERPSITVIAGISFGLYRIILAIAYSESITPNLFLSQISTVLALSLILWYIQSNRISVRAEVIAWACSVLVIEMLLFWVVAQLVLGAPRFTPPRSLLAVFLAKGERYIPGSGNANYLLPYWPEDKLGGGLVRFAFFFPGPESFALAAGFIGLVALGIRNRIWSALLFLACVFFLFLSGTRSTWTAFPVVLAVWYFLLLSKFGGRSILFGFLAVSSFVILSLPTITDSLYDTVTNTAAATDNLRANSTEVRSLIYARTLDAILTEPDNLLLGRGVLGNTVLPGYEPARVGSHSFILGSLLYRSGLIGTGIFLTFWVSFIQWLFKTRKSRPLYCFLTILFFTLTFSTMELELSLVVLIPVIALSRQDSIQSEEGRKNKYA